MEYKKTPETNKSLAERIAARGARSFMEINKELIALQAKHDELVELVAWYMEVSIFYWVETCVERLDTINRHRVKDTIETYDAIIELTLSYHQAEDALRKAVEEK
jgi:hypothetical protein